VSNPYAPSGDDGWGPSTSVRSGADASRPEARPVSPPRAEQRGGGQPRDDERSEWAPAGPASSRDQRAARRTDRRIEQQIAGMRSPRDARPAATRDSAPRVRERGLPWWAALIVLVVIAAIGGAIDTIGSISVRGGFNIGIVVASVVAVLLVKRSHMFPIVIAPPIVYSVAALFQLYLRSSGLHDKKVVFDAASNYLVYGFPAIAAATAAVLIIAGIRMITRK
jgi:uncharacterized protein DUF6542